MAALASASLRAPRACANRTPNARCVAAAHIAPRRCSQPRPLRQRLRLAGAARNARLQLRCATNGAPEALDAGAATAEDELRDDDVLPDSLYDAVVQAGQTTAAAIEAVRSRAATACCLLALPSLLTVPCSLSGQRTLPGGAASSRAVRQHKRQHHGAGGRPAARVGGAHLARVHGTHAPHLTPDTRLAATALPLLC